MRRTSKSTISRRQVKRIIDRHVKEAAHHFKTDKWDLDWFLIAADIRYDILKVLDLVAYADIPQVTERISKEVPVKWVFDNHTIYIRLDKKKRKKKK